jgi:NTP pyrophosphatase (non-canonical NTP hydrolase)
MTDDSLADLLREIRTFRDAREWERFHTVRHLAAALSVEAAELQEAILWKTDDEVSASLAESDLRTRVGHEIADVLIYSLLLCHACGLDPAAVIRAKLKLNSEKYPVELARGSAKKYTELSSPSKAGDKG